MCRLYKKKRIFAKQIKHINIMAKTLRILFLGLAIVLSGTAMAQNKSAGRNVRNDKVMRLKNGRQKPAKKAKKAPLFTKTTTVFSEDFSNGLDTAWRTYDQDGDGWNWFYDPYSTAMLSYSYDTDNYNPITPIDYLITPKIRIPAVGAKLSFNAWAVDYYYPYDHFYVMVSPSGSDVVDSFYTTIYYDSVPDIPQNYQVSLAQFAGQQIRIAFVHVDTVDYWGMAIDDVEVFIPDSVEIGVVSTNVYPTVAASNNATVTAEIINNGFANFTNLTAYCDVNGTVTTTTVASLPGMQSATATFTGIDFSQIESIYNVKVYVSDPADIDNTNDTVSASTMAFPAPSLVWDFEGDTNLPAGFTTGRYDNGTAYSNWFFPNNEAWVVFDDTQYEFMEDTPYIEGGTNAAMSESYFDENDSGYEKSNYPANRWMVTPKIHLTTGNYITWDGFSMDEEYLETYRVRISTTTADTASFTTLTTINDENAYWTRRFINLSAYAGQNVRIAFQDISDDMFRLLIDNIKICGPATISTDPDPDPEGLTVAENDVRIYPNPASGNIYINANAPITLVELIDMTGRVVMTQDGDVKSLNISALTEGIYTLRVVSENGVSLKRVVKK